MQERPIIFNTEMVMSIPDGRKTQTRRPINPQPFKDEYGWTVFQNKNVRITDQNSAFNPFEERFPEAIADGLQHLSPFGDVGDQLWVRETFCLTECGCSDYCSCPKYTYKADQNHQPTIDELTWTPSIHMPRSASRIQLLVKRIWVERVQDISEEDAKAEGVKPCVPTHWGCERADYRQRLRILWDSIYGTWEENPWVWACEFEAIETLKVKQ